MPNELADVRDAVEESEAGPQPSVARAALEVSNLLPAARTARDVLAANGKALTRKALARQIRADGYAASNARVSALLKILEGEQDDAVTPDRNAAA